MKIVILDGYAENPGDLSWDELERFGEYTVFERTPPELIISRAQGADIIVTNKTPLTRQTLEQLPDVKFVALLSTGYNVVDYVYLAERGIPVSNIPAYSTKSVAQLVFAFVLELFSHVGLYNESVKNGEWVNCRDFCYYKVPLSELDGKTMGIIGYGSIGKTVAGIAKAFGMNVLATSASRHSGEDGTVRFCGIEELLNNSDVVSVHCPLLPETQGLVDYTFLSEMKQSAVIINTSRGGVVNEQALADALNSGRIAGAGVDVLSTEPPKADNPLLTAKNCLITPHIAWAPLEARKRLMNIFIANIAAFADGKPQNVVNGVAW